MAPAPLTPQIAEKDKASFNAFCSNVELNEINTAYHHLELKQAEIIHALFHRIFELESGWYNGHYHRGVNIHIHKAETECCTCLFL